MSEALADIHALRRARAFLDVDRDGFVQKNVSLATVQPSWRPAIETARDLAVRRCGAFLDSLYVLGSSARGCAIDGVSDLDMIAITTIDYARVDPQWPSDIAAGICRDFPFVASLELSTTVRADVPARRGLKVLLKLHTVCIHGRDLAEEIPGYRLGPDLAGYCRYLQADLLSAIGRASRDDGPARVAATSEWIMKRVLRAGFELVMERVGRLTSHSALCAEAFCRYYPEQRSLMWKVLEYAEHPTSDRAHVIGVAAACLAWFPGEIVRVFGPQHAEPYPAAAFTSRSPAARPGDMPHRACQR